MLQVAHPGGTAQPLLTWCSQESTPLPNTLTGLGYSTLRFLVLPLPPQLTSASGLLRPWAPNPWQGRAVGVRGGGAWRRWDPEGGGGSGPRLAATIAAHLSP